MLILTRCMEEVVVITTPEGREIRVQVVGVDRGKVKLGFVADVEVRVMRSELVDGKPKEAA